MTKRIHTYSDGSQIELGGEPGKGWLNALRTKPADPAPRKRRPGWAMTEALKEGPDSRGRQF